MGERSPEVGGCSHPQGGEAGGMGAGEPAKRSWWWVAGGRLLMQQETAEREAVAVH